jgi:hypothetical protein
MNKVAEFAATVEEGDHFISFDIEGGYRYFFLAEPVRNFFLFPYDGRVYRCIALPFGWSRSAYWFVNLLKPFVRKLRKWDYWTFPYVDDFLMAPSVGRAATSLDC